MIYRLKEIIYKFTSKCQSQTTLYSDGNTWIGMEIASTMIFEYILGYLSEAANKLYTANLSLSFSNIYEIGPKFSS